MSAFVDQERGRFGVEPICRELEVSSRAYRERRRGRVSRRGQRDRVIAGEIRRVHAESGSSYGSWRCWRQLNRDGIRVARCTVERLMRQELLSGVVHGKTQRTTRPGSSPVPAADLVKRRFTASRPDELWVCDFTYVRTWGGWAYLAIVLDVYSRRIVGWQLAPHMRESLVDDALQMAIAGRENPAAPLVAHTDNGAQYTASGYSQRLADASIVLGRGEWQISRVYVVLGRPEPAVHHAHRCLAYVEQGDGIEEWDLPFAYEALARAHAIAGDSGESLRY